jgi:hypothetical protein
MSTLFQVFNTSVFYVYNVSIMILNLVFNLQLLITCYFNHSLFDDRQNILMVLHARALNDVRMGHLRACLLFEVLP